MNKFNKEQKANFFVASFMIIGYTSIIIFAELINPSSPREHFNLKKPFDTWYKKNIYNYETEALRNYVKWREKTQKKDPLKKGPQGEI